MFSMKPSSWLQEGRIPQLQTVLFSGQTHEPHPHLLHHGKERQDKNDIINFFTNESEAFIKRIKRDLSLIYIPGDAEYLNLLKNVPQASETLPKDFLSDEGEVNNNSQIEGSQTLCEQSRKILDSLSSSDGVKITIDKKKVNKHKRKVKKRALSREEKAYLSREKHRKLGKMGMTAQQKALERKSMVPLDIAIEEVT